jgi:hypothetical protein
VDIRTQKALAWSGPLSLVLTVSALGITGFVPLPSLAMPSPTASAEQTATFYRAHSSAICIGAIVFMVSAAVYLGFIAVLSAQIKRIEGDRRTFTYLQLAAGAASMTPLIVAPLAWCVAAFRPERNPEIIQAFNDLAFIAMLMVTPLAVVQVLAVGLAILSDKRARPIFPRWVAHASFVCALGLQVGVLCVLTRTGPFAWDGAITGTLDNLIMPWTILMCVMLLKAIKRQEAEEVRRAADVNPRGVLTSR